MGNFIPNSTLEYFLYFKVQNAASVGKKTST